MRGVAAFALVWLLAGDAVAQLPPPPRFVEPGTKLEREPPPPVGACIGGECGSAPKPRALALPRPRSSGRLARAAAIFGVISAGLSIGGAVAIAVVDDFDSEVVTRSIWLGQVATATPIVALSAYRARRGRAAKGVRSARALGWAAYSAAISQGVLQLALAAQGYRTKPALTIGASAFAALAVLPHAFDALVCARSARTQPPRAVVRPSLTGLTITF